MPDSFGIDWVSGLYGGETIAHVIGSWQIYEHSGNRTFLGEAYKFYKELFWDGPVDRPFGYEYDSVLCLNKMAEILMMWSIGTLLLIGLILNIGSRQSGKKTHPECLEKQSMEEWDGQILHPLVLLCFPEIGLIPWPKNGWIWTEIYNINININNSIEGFFGEVPLSTVH